MVSQKRANSVSDGSKPAKKAKLRGSSNLECDLCFRQLDEDPCLWVLRYNVRRHPFIFHEACFSSMAGKQFRESEGIVFSNSSEPADGWFSPPHAEEEDPQ